MRLSEVPATLRTYPGPGFPGATVVVRAQAGLNPDLYQLLAHATATDLPEATLIYADGPPQPRTHHLRHRHIDLHVHHLELDQSPKQVLRDLAHLAAHVEGQRTQGETSSQTTRRSSTPATPH